MSEFKFPAVLSASDHSLSLVLFIDGQVPKAILGCSSCCYSNSKTLFICNNMIPDQNGNQGLQFIFTTWVASRPQLKQGKSLLMTNTIGIYYIALIIWHEDFHSVKQNKYTRDWDFTERNVWWKQERAVSWRNERTVFRNQERIMWWMQERFCVLPATVFFYS